MEKRDMEHHQDAGNVNPVAETNLMYGDSCFSVASALLNQEAKHLSDFDLVSLLFGINRSDAQVWLSQAGSLRKLVDSSAMGKALMEFSSRYLLEVVKRGEVLNDPDNVRAFLVSTLRDEKSEKFCVLFLDNRHRVIAFEEMFNGTVNGASVHPREVVRRCLEHNSAAVILAHNHPSGVAEVSQADERITKRLQQALELIDVSVLDHFIVGDRVVSMAEKGMI